MQDNNSKRYKIAIDAMGGDFAPKSEVEGAVRALQSLKSKTNNLEIVLYGIESEINKELNKHANKNLNISVVNCEEVVTMKDEPTVALKFKKDSSLYQGVYAQRKGEVDAFISAGNTGAVMSTATVLLGRLENVSRPTIGSFFPTDGLLPTLVLDVGATVDLKSRFLYEYAIMGSIYSNQMLGITNPRVGLLNVGEEESKGPDEIKETYKLLKESKLNFIGNVEGRDILLGGADIVICDGYTGNIILKFAESFLGLLKGKIKSYADKSIFNKLRTALMLPTLKKVLADLDYQKHGGVPLLGVNGNVIIGHGKSSPIAIENMIIRASEMIGKDLNDKMQEALNI